MNIVSIAVFKLFLLTFFGFFLFRRSFIKENTLNFLASFVINFTVPFLIFSHLIEKAQAVLVNSPGIFLLISLGIFLSGYLLSVLFSLGRKKPFKQEFRAIVSFQNAGYLPLAMAVFLFEPAMRDEFLVYIFLNLLGFNIIMWSIGSFMVFRKKGQKFEIMSIFTPPISATIIALVFIYSNASGLIPEIILDPLRMVGNLSFVLSAIILGCWLAKVNLKGVEKNIFMIVQAGLLKSVLLPFLTLLGVFYLRLSPFLGLFVVMQAAMPTAASLPIVAQMRGADSQFISQGVFFTHLLSIFTISFWVGLYLYLFGLYL